MTAPDAHCRRKGCPCTHTEGCDRGWIEQPDGTVRKCPVCNDRTLPAPSDQHGSWGLR